MTTGPQHYAAAEELIATVDDGNAPDTELTVEQLLAMAQVHATLALAAATAEHIVIQLPDSIAGEEWSAAFAEPRDEDDNACYAGTGAPMAQPGPEPLFAQPAEI